MFGLAKKTLAYVCAGAMIISAMPAFALDAPSTAVAAQKAIGNFNAPGAENFDSKEYSVSFSDNTQDDTYSYYDGSDAKTPKAYLTSGIGGKADTDYSAYVEYKDVPGDTGYKVNDGANSPNKMYIPIYGAKIGGESELTEVTQKFSMYIESGIPNAYINYSYTKSSDGGNFGYTTNGFYFDTAAGTVTVKGGNTEKFNVGAWNDIAMTMYKTDDNKVGCKYYVNGKLAATRNLGGDTTTVQYNFRFLHFGAEFNGVEGSAEKYGGIIAVDDYECYNGTYKDADTSIYTTNALVPSKGMTYNFNDGAKSLAYSQPDEFKGDYGTEYYMSGSGKVATAVLKPAIGGKGNNDYSSVINYKDVPNNVSIPNNSVSMVGTWEVEANSARTLEYNILVDGTVDNVYFLYRTKGDAGNQSYYRAYEFNTAKNTVSIGGKTVSYIPGTWNSIAMTLNSNGMLDFYFNGKYISSTLSLKDANEENFYGWSWARLMTAYNKDVDGDATAYKSGMVAVDDIAEYEGKYTKEIEIAAYEDDNIFIDKYLAKTAVRDGVTAGELLSKMSVSTECTLAVVDANGNERESGDKIQDGDLVRIATADGLVSYEPVTTDLTLGGSDFEDENVQFILADAQNAIGTQELASASGLFGKSAGDRAVGLSAKDIPAVSDNDTALGYRFARAEILNIPGSPLRVAPVVMNSADTTKRSAHTYTMKFAYMGDADTYKVYGRPYYRTDEGSNKASFVTLLTIDKGGVGRAEIGKSKFVFDTKFRQNAWYDLAFTFTGDGFVSVTVNGNEEVPSTDMRSADDQTGAAYVGFNWMSVNLTMNESDNAASLRNAAVYVDDVEVYLGKYIPTEECAVTSDVYHIDQKNGIIYTDVTDIDEFVSNVDFGTSEPVLYTDNTYTDEADEIGADSVLVLKSEDGKTIRYYTFASPTLVIGDIVTYVNGEESNILENGTLGAKISVYSPEQFGNTGILAIAAYKDGKMIAMNAQPKAMNGSTDYEVSITVDDTEGVTAKAMFVGKGLKPYTEAAQFITIK